MSDLISRQAARNALLNKGQHSKRYKLGETWELNLMEIEETLGELPSVTLQPELGRWIDDKCSVCGKGTENLISSPEWYRNEDPNFCPFCGAKMIESQESEKYCDHNICVLNGYNGIGCDDCEVTKSREPQAESEEV